MAGSPRRTSVKENEAASLALSKPSTVLGAQKKATLTIIGNDYGKEADRAARIPLRVP